MIKLRTVIELAGFPKEHIEESMQKIITHAKQNKDVVVLNVVLSEAKQMNNMWSTYGEFELEFNSVSNLLDFCFDYTPSYIEILDINEILLKSLDFSNFINDLLAKLHHYNLVITNINAENMVLKNRLDGNNKINISKNAAPSKTKNKKKK